jgi:hypothetical protein
LLAILPRNWPYSPSDNEYFCPVFLRISSVPSGTGG